jgi:AcrR family transcriptional regulator
MIRRPADERPRVGREETREALIEATAQIMLDEGYAAATSRRVAAKAGVKPALVHYYFPSMDDLFVAVLRDKAENNLQRQRQAIAEAQPLHALWLLNSATDAQLFTEFLAMANHRKAIRSEISAYAMRFRDLEEGVVTLALKARGVDLELFPPVVMSMIMGGLARMVLHEQGLGITHGHKEATAFIERCLERFEMPSWDEKQPGSAQLSDPARADGKEVTGNTIA